MSSKLFSLYFIQIKSGKVDCGRDLVVFKD